MLRNCIKRWFLPMCEVSNHTLCVSLLLRGAPLGWERQLCYECILYSVVVSHWLGRKTSVWIGRVMRVRSPDAARHRVQYSNLFVYDNCLTCVQFRAYVPQTSSLQMDSPERQSFQSLEYRDVSDDTGPTIFFAASKSFRQIYIP